MPELLLELYSEEIPAGMQARAAATLARLVGEGLADAGLDFDKTAAHATPRRLCLAVEGLPARQPDTREERRGPRIDAPERAIAGFLRSVGLTRDQVVAREGPKGTFLHAVIERQGSETRAVLPDVLVTAICALPWQKSMRWAGNRFRWVRPLHHILALFDGQVLNGALPLGAGNMPFTNITCGHRFLAAAAIPVSGFADYRDKLRAAHVILDREERKAIIVAASRALAAREDLVLRDDPALLDEVCGLVEWPVALMGSIDAVFMTVPPEVLVAAMRMHQKYFALETVDGDLAPRFVTISNMAADGARDRTIIAGNEKVLRARLSDARFFWDQDRRHSLASRVAALAAVTFYDKLGTLEDKARRMERLAGDLAAFVPGCDAGHARRAARLAKADLTTGMVGEFPSLQGIMGHHYASQDGEAAAVCRAIAEHYTPQGPSDSCPTAPASVAVALADKLDTLTGFFAIGERPTGSRDPFALRRAALGIIRLVLVNNLRLPLRRAIAMAHAGYEGLGAPEGLLDFFADRLKVHLREQGVRHDLIAAVFARGDEDDVKRLMARVAALADFLASEDGNNLLVAHRRAANIVRIESGKDGESYGGRPDATRFEAMEEAALHDALAAVAAPLPERIAAEDFTGAMRVLAQLRAPIDSYFDHVTVNVEEPALRQNRLEILASIVATMDQVADFSQVEG